MFEEEFNKLSRGDREIFKKTVNYLLYSSFVTRKTYDKQLKISKTNQSYIFIEANYSLFEEYLSFMDVDINKDDQDGVIYITSISDYNHLRINVQTTLIVFALRSYYEGEVAKNPTESFILMNNIKIMSLLNELGLSNMTKRLSSSNISESLSFLSSYNILNRVTGTYSDPTYSFYITPAIRYVISSEKMNTLYQLVTNQDENNGDNNINSDNFFNENSKENNLNNENSIFNLDGDK